MWENPVLCFHFVLYFQRTHLTLSRSQKNVTVIMLFRRDSKGIIKWIAHIPKRHFQTNQDLPIAFSISLIYIIHIHIVYRRRIHFLYVRTHFLYGKHLEKRKNDPPYFDIGFLFVILINQVKTRPTKKKEKKKKSKRFPVICTCQNLALTRFYLH